MASDTPAACSVMSAYLPAGPSAPDFPDELHTVWARSAGAPAWLAVRCGKGAAADARTAAALAAEALALGFTYDEVRVLLSN